MQCDVDEIYIDKIDGRIDRLDGRIMEIDRIMEQFEKKVEQHKGREWIIGDSGIRLNEESEELRNRKRVDIMAKKIYNFDRGNDESPIL